MSLFRLPLEIAETFLPTNQLSIEQCNIVRLDTILLFRRPFFGSPLYLKLIKESYLLLKCSQFQIGSFWFSPRSHGVLWVAFSFFFVPSILFYFFFHIKLICFFPSNWYVKLWNKRKKRWCITRDCFMGLMDKLDHFQRKMFSFHYFCNQNCNKIFCLLECLRYGLNYC